VARNMHNTRSDSLPIHFVTGEDARTKDSMNSNMDFAGFDAFVQFRAHEIAENKN
jgi:hypothetical protein